MPYVEIGGRFGLFSGIDAGIRYTPLYSLGLDVKYRLYAGRSLALAAGLGRGLMEIPKNDSAGTSQGRDLDEDETETAMADFLFPVYASYDFGKRFTAYVNPKFVHRTFPGLGTRQNLAGASAGFKWGKNRGIFLEATRMRILGTGLTTTQWSGAYFQSAGGGNKSEADEETR
jgi:hypothetical protein